MNARKALWQKQWTATTDVEHQKAMDEMKDLCQQAENSVKPRSARECYDRSGKPGSLLSLTPSGRASMVDINELDDDDHQLMADTQARARQRGWVANPNIESFIPDQLEARLPEPPRSGKLGGCPQLVSCQLHHQPWVPMHLSVGETWRGWLLRFSER